MGNHILNIRRIWVIAVSIAYVSAMKSHLLFEQEIGQLDHLFGVGRRSYRLADARSDNKFAVYDGDGFEMEFVFDAGAVVVQVSR